MATINLYYIQKCYFKSIFNYDKIENSGFQKCVFPKN